MKRTIKAYRDWTPRAPEHINWKLTATGSGAHKTDKRPSRARRKAIDRRDAKD